MCTSASTACWATSSGVENSGPTSTSKPMSAKARDDDLLAAVVAVLAHLGDQDARAAALGLLERVGGRRATCWTSSSPPRGAGLVPEHAGDRTDRGLVAAVDLLQRVGDLADRRLGAGRVDREREQVAVQRAPARRPRSAELVSASSERRTSSSSRSARSRSSLATCWR